MGIEIIALPYKNNEDVLTKDCTVCWIWWEPVGQSIIGALQHYLLYDDSLFGRYAKR